MVSIYPALPPEKFRNRRVTTTQHNEWNWDVSTTSCPQDIVNAVNETIAEIGGLLSQFNTAACEGEMTILFDNGIYDMTGNINWYSSNANAAIQRILPEIDQLLASIVTLTNGRVSGNIVFQQTVEFPR